MLSDWPMREEDACWEDLADDPPDVLMLVGILLGQADGRVEITSQMIVAARRMAVERTYNAERDVYVFRLRAKEAVSG